MQSSSDSIVQFIDPIKDHIEADGGSVEFIELTEDSIVRLKVAGSTKPCHDCPDPMNYCNPCIMVTDHLKMDLKRSLLISFPEINGVEYD